MKLSPTKQFSILLKFIKFFGIILILSFPIFNTNTTQRGGPLENGYIPDLETAIKIAEAVWLPIYGKEIYKKQPFVGELKSETTWIVKGTVPKTALGGVPYIKIRKKDGAVLEVYHTK